MSVHEASKALRKKFRRYARGGRYKVGVRDVQAFCARGWIGTRPENPAPGLVMTAWHVTEAGRRVLEGCP